MSSKKRVLLNKVQRLNKSLSQRSWETYQNVLKATLKAFPTEVQNKVLGLLKAKNFVELLSWADSFGGVEHTTAATTFAANQLVALIKKYPFPTEELKELSRSSALVKFRQAENSCRRYNLKFSRVGITRWDRHNDILHRMSSWISRVIGLKPNYSEIYDECGFGPGASIGIHGNSTNLARKLLAEEWTCTPSALPYAVSALAQDHHVWELILPNVNGIFCMDIENFRKGVNDKVRLVQHNKIVTVPKTALVDRTIAIEPLLNGYLQKGADIVLRRRLKRVGIDLSDQSINQDLARLGSTQDDDPFVTIDLSSASDLINLGIARRVLPPDWFDFLNSIRSSYYELDGVISRYHKFVSMGNGFCFPLETLIFASVCQLFSKPNNGEFAVYGDDIVVRQSVASQVLQTLRYIGFRQNPDKTFLEGPFRESCGADWFAGLNIRPLTLDYELSSLDALIKFFNMSLEREFIPGFFEDVREYILNLVPRQLQFMRPYKGTSLGAFEVPMDMFQASVHSTFDRYCQSWSWLELEFTGQPDRLVSTHERYSTALMMAAVRGSPYRCPFAKRRKTSQSIRRKTYAGASSTWLPLS